MVDPDEAASTSVTDFTSGYDTASHQQVLQTERGVKPGTDSSGKSCFQQQLSEEQFDLQSDRKLGISLLDVDRLHGLVATRQVAMKTVEQDWRLQIRCVFPSGANGATDALRVRTQIVTVQVGCACLSPMWRRRVTAGNGMFVASRDHAMINCGEM
jgi:hypothetical protein